MELDELKSAWGELERRLSALEVRDQAREEARRREQGVRRSRGALRQHALVLAFELACGVLLSLFVGRFLASHFHEPKFALPAAVLGMALLVSTVTSAVCLWILLRLDYSAPVLSIQRRLAEVRATRTRAAQWTLLLAPLLWTPLAIVLSKAWLGLDAYAGLGSGYVLLNLAVGILVIPLGIQAARACARYPWLAPRWRRFVESLAGTSLARAIGALDELERYEAER